MLSISVVTPRKRDEIIDIDMLVSRLEREMDVWFEVDLFHLPLLCATCWTEFYFVTVNEPPMDIWEG